MQTKSIFLCFLLCCFTVKQARCQCRLEVNTSPERRPIFTKTVGSNEIRVKIEDHIVLYEKENITGQCATKFEPISYYSSAYSRTSHVGYYDSYETTTPRSILDLDNRSSIDLYCSSGNIYLDGAQKEMLVYNKLSCEAIKWGIRETKRHLPWCSEETASYILAAKNLEPKIVLGSLCYNLRNMTMESFRYTTYNFSFTQEPRYYVQYPVDLESKLLSDNNIEPEELKDHHLEDDFSNLNFNHSENTFLSTAKYEPHSIVLGQAFYHIFSGYVDVLNIKWWTNLYKTNWQRFAAAFEERSAHKIYDVYLGVSGQLIYPIIKSCDGTDPGGIKFKAYEGNIPAYVWAYVRALDDNDEFVFISYNSPFYEFFNSTDIIFCEDICSKIPWLSDVQKTFRYSTLGVSFCCSTEAVRNSTILNGFPRIYEPAQLMVKATTAEIITEIIDKTILASTPTPKSLFSEEDLYDEGFA